MTLRTKGEQKAYLDGYEMCAGCIEKYLTDEGKQKLACLLMSVKNAVENDISTESGDMLYDIFMAGVNMAGEYKGVWVRFKDIETIVNKHVGRGKNDSV